MIWIETVRKTKNLVLLTLAKQLRISNFKGARQEDPISAYLFHLALEV